MKNKRKLAVISLVVMMMITAVGYAAFSDSLKIDGTANNARFDVQFVEQSVSGKYVSVETVEPDLMDASFHWPPADDPDVVSVSVSNLIPGKSCTVSGTLVNKGTVHAYSDGTWNFIGGAPSYYDVSLTLPETLNPYDGTGTYTLTVTMHDNITEAEGVEIGKYKEDFDIQLGYHQ